MNTLRRIPDVVWRKYRKMLEGQGIPEIDRNWAAEGPQPVPRGNKSIEQVSPVDTRYGNHLQELSRSLRSRRYSPRTEKTYLHWVDRFFRFLGRRPPEGFTFDQARSFLEHLVLEQKLAVNTQRLALNALAYFFGEVLHTPLGDLGDFARSSRPRRLPVVLSRREIESIFEVTEGIYTLILGLLYGSGMRLMETVRLRVKDVDFD